MQGPLRALRRRAARIAIAAAFAAAWPGPGGAQGTERGGTPRAQAALTAEVPAGRHKALRLRNLPRDARVAVAVQATGRVVVSFLDEAGFRRFPEPAEALFVAPVERAASFVLTMPAAGDYYVVLDNRAGAEARKVKLAIRAARGAPAEGSTAPRPLDPGAPQHEM